MFIVISHQTQPSAPGVGFARLEKKASPFSDCLAETFVT
jgi:hypothetical protein